MTYFRFSGAVCAIVVATFLSGCCTSKDTSMEGPVTDGDIVRQHVVQNSVSPARAVNTVVTAVAMRLNMTFGGEKLAMSITQNGVEDHYSIGQSAYYKLLAVGSIKPHFPESDKKPELTMINNYSMKDDLLMWNVMIFKAGVAAPICEKTVAVKVKRSKAQTAAAPVVQ